MTIFELNGSAIQYGKIKTNHMLKNVGNWEDFTLQTRCLVDILLFLHGVLIMVHIVCYRLVSPLSLIDPKLVLEPQTPRSRHF